MGLSMGLMGIGGEILDAEGSSKNYKEARSRLGEPAKSVQHFIRHLSKSLPWSRSPNYEDISGVLRNVISSCVHDQNDPLSNAFLQDRRIVELLQGMSFPVWHRFHDYPLVERLRVIEDYVGWVSASLIKTLPQLVGYENLVELCDWFSEHSLTWNIMTTNYDCNIERVFNPSKISFSDGFVEGLSWGDETLPLYDCNGRRWKTFESFTSSESSERPMLIKLHGSLNWHLLKDLTSGLTVVGSSPLNVGPTYGRHIKVRSPPYASFLSPESPLMLRGSLSKAADYHYGIFADLQRAFEEMLLRTDVVVVAGFGWSDEVISQKLGKYITSPKRILLVFDGSSDGAAILRGGLFAAGNRLNRLVGGLHDRRPVIVYPKHLSELEKGEGKAVIKIAISSPLLRKHFQITSDGSPTCRIVTL